uniref:Integrase catalytic domain-containing protein n=1 Tax=Amphimedon queenslandica TaxID=400682 RepID=A0A1X7TSG7_AMPQE
DAYSKWIEAAIIPSTSSKALFKILHSVFATHGVPEHMASDNGSGFTSEQFQ